MTLFTDGGFQNGRWAGSLAKLLRPLHLIPDLVPKGRIWRGTWQQWIQFEPSVSIGPVFWMGKASIRSSATALYVGYYVERGLKWAEGIKQEYITTEDWHWHGFVNCLKEGSLHALLMDLPADRRCIWIENDEIDLDERIGYTNESSLRQVENFINNIADNHWINVMLGNSYSKDECLKTQNQIVQEFRTPVVRAYEIDTLVKASM
jgi:hypothetical protein